MKIEVLHAPGCARCSRELDGLRAAAHALDPSVQWHELDILKAIDYAVALGVLKPPTPGALAAAMRARRVATG